MTYSKTNLYRNLKLACQVSSNTISIFLMCIYLEIIELHFCDLDKYIRKKILERESEDTNLVYLLNNRSSNNIDDKNEEKLKNKEENIKNNGENIKNNEKNIKNDEENIKSNEDIDESLKAENTIISLQDYHFTIK